MLFPRMLSKSSFSDAEYFRFIHVPSSCVLAANKSTASKREDCPVVFSFVVEQVRGLLQAELCVRGRG